MLKIKRVYEQPDKNDGVRMLVDRLWPRGVRKEDAKIDQWMKDIAPSDELRSWFAHRAERWNKFKKLYCQELQTKQNLVQTLRAISKKNTVTLLYAAKDNLRNNAVVLQEYIENKQVEN
ncbi:MAG TPA: DUF488 domain-containing protein [Sedimentisphaerales bacterium]|nr:DUF488 domain-containing protein [Sedimentisphaerales bacterium]